MSNAKYITQEQLADLSQRKNPILTKIKLIIDNSQFNVGDFVIKLEKSYDWDTDKLPDEFTPEYIDYNLKVPQKFVCVHIDDEGVRYLKELEENNLEGIEDQEVIDVFSGTNFFDDEDNQDVSCFVVDPEYQDHLLISPDLEYDPSASYAEAQERFNSLEEKNADIQEFFATVKDAEDFLKNVKVGDTIYDESGDPIVVSKVENKTLKKKDYHWKAYNNFKMPSYTEITGTITDSDGDSYEVNWTPASLAGNSIFTQKPFTMDDV